jgi:chorismate mutase
MTVSLPPLDVLRQEIDRIDDAMHDLLMERAALVDRIRAAKPAGRPILRPGREAMVLRRLLDRHKGPYPPQALIRLWREMMGSFAAMQADVSIVTSVTMERTARRHFGGAFNYRTVADDNIALSTILSQSATAAVLSWPSVTSDWWLRLSECEHRPNIVSAIPFLTRRVDHEGVVVAYVELEKTGDDKTLLVVPSGDEFQYPNRLIAMAQGKCLVETNGFLSDEALYAIPGAIRLGVYATPYQAQD